MGSRPVIGGVLAVLALVAIIAPGGASGGDDTSQPYPTRQLAIMAPAWLIVWIAAALAGFVTGLLRPLPR